jgi:hypothetical protein
LVDLQILTTLSHIIYLYISTTFVFSSFNRKYAQNGSSINPLTGFNPPLFISKYQAVNNHMRLIPYRPHTHDQGSNRVREYHIFFTPSIIEAQMCPLCSLEKLQMLHRGRNICYTIHCHVTTMQWP